MGFGSAIFLFGFLPLTVLLFHLLPGSRGRQALLAAAGLIFYAFGRLWDVPILLASVLVHYAAGRLLLGFGFFRQGVLPFFQAQVNQAGVEIQVEVGDLVGLKVVHDLTQPHRAGA